MTAIAHVRRDENGYLQPHELTGQHGHLISTASLAQKFASEFKAEDWAYAAGLWHDLGKFKPDFQDYIRNRSGYERDEADEGGPGKVDHTAAGAIHAFSKHKVIGKILAYIIAGHHSGLPDWLKEKESGRGLEERISQSRHLA